MDLAPGSMRVGSTELLGRPAAQINDGHAAGNCRAQNPAYRRASSLIFPAWFFVSASAGTTGIAHTAGTVAGKNANPVLHSVGLHHIGQLRRGKGLAAPALAVHHGHCRL